jgi:hypothetical protein
VSDFFANVAARTRDTQDLVQPRLPARFETTEGALDQAFVAPLEASVEPGVPPEAAPRKPARSRAPAAGTPLATAARGAAGEARRTAEIPATIAAQPPARPSPEAVEPVVASALVHKRAPARADVVAPAARPQLRVRDERRVEERPEPSHDHTVEPRVRREHAARALAAGDVPQRETVRGRPDGDRDPVQTRRPVREAGGVVPVAARIVAQPPLPAIQPRVVRAAPQRSPLPAPARAQETTVHVSIGRIEVRATPHAAEPRRDAAASPVMSLGEYLSSRSGRGR